MNVPIEVYRNWEIFFNTDEDLFYAGSEKFDSSMSSKSYTAIKARVDEHIKANVAFKPFWIEKVEDIYQARETVLVVSVRKDGKFVIKKNGKMVQLDSYDEQKYFFVHPDNEVKQNEVLRLKLEIKRIEKEIGGIVESMEKGKWYEQKREEYKDLISKK